MTTKETRSLDDDQKEKVRGLIRERGVTCAGCGWRDFTVGDALELGYLFHNEEHGMYMVGLRCENPDCDTPTGVRVHESQIPRRVTRPGP